ncbi:hypothetical protein NUH88_08935 [Nisaea acidiphila]|uniref:Uncharacterized protein n=1 Tax=Nisaea acidiphila TaxID=1862145 RepID=A0A9J7AZZ6_9PROT|nr:hypothetical protein [Nisaea acidiphila]UUX51812.1 hypothetical protein NUH88_08935 [Nisaea acidiphila]
MSWSATIGDRTFTEANLDGNAYAEEESGFPAIVRAIAEETAALKGVAALSTSSRVPASGSVAFALGAAPPPAWKPGQVLRASSAGDTTHFMVGTITAISDGEITLDVSFPGGSGAREDWVLTYPLFWPYLRLNGGTISGGLKIDGHSLLLNAPPEQFLYVRMMRNEQKFLDFGLDDTPVTGTASGSRVYLHTFDNNGGWTGRPLEIDRATGEIRTLSIDVQENALMRADLRGTRMGIEALGSLGTETVSITADRWNALAATMDGNPTFDFTVLGNGFEYTRKLRLTQGTGGGFVPIWTLGGDAAGVKRIGVQPGYANQPAGTVTRVTAEVWGSELRLWETEEH